MKKIFLIICILIGFKVQAQTVQPLYLRFDGEKVDYYQRKQENTSWSPQNQNLDEDIFRFYYPVFYGLVLELATVDKRNSLEINISELSNYDVKTIQEIDTYLTDKTQLEKKNYWIQYMGAKNLYLVEIIPNTQKVRIHQVWITSYRGE